MLANVSLRPYNTFGIDVIAKNLVIVNSNIALAGLLLDPNWFGIEKLILGRGSNVLFSRDYEGLIILIRIAGITCTGQTEEDITLRVGAGEDWHSFVLYCVEHGYAGVENLSLIPGTVGAAPLQNIGAYGVEVKNVIESVEAMNIETGEVRFFSNAECKFGYRESIFKRELKGQFVITAVNFKLSKKPQFQTEYGDIRRVLEEKNISKLSLKAISDAVIQIRTSKLPDPSQIGNAGSFFKNPEIPISQFEELKVRFPNIPGYPMPNGIKVAAGWLIEQAGWKGFRSGEVGVHAKQALVLVNYGGGTGIEIRQLSAQIQNSVSSKFGIQLTPEVNFI